MARPPRTPDDTPDTHAEEFIAGASGGDTDAKARPAEGYPWEDTQLRADVSKPFNLRLSEPTKARLQWLSERSPESMHQIAVEAVEAEIERRVREVTG